ncbi:hypothetical protein KQH61_04150 [bacterium]|nr:hypothetical protein [bacterium]MCB2179095.1 hypothetical protein [bacterium]
MDFLDRLIHALTVTHPIHPMLVHFPIALSGAAALFILVAVWKKDKTLETIAFANLVLTVLGTIAAGATGMYDNQLTYGGDAPNAGLKIILAMTLLVISTATVMIRWKNPTVFQSNGKTLYVLAYIVSFLLALVLAFLGGVILYGF